MISLRNVLAVVSVRSNSYRHLFGWLVTGWVCASNAITAPFANVKKALKILFFGAFFVPAICVASARCVPSSVDGLLPVSAVQVTDGDSVRVHIEGQKRRRKVRLIGLNTPELGRDNEPAEPWARAAKRAVQERLNGAQRIFLQLGEDTQDRYGRYLAHVYWLDDSKYLHSLEYSLLSAGLAHAIAVPPNTDWAQCLFNAEREAKRKHEGVWSLSVRDAGDINSGGFAFFRGRVKAVSASSNGVVWVDLHGPIVLRLSLSVVEFGLSGWSELPGRQVEVRGWVIDRRRSKHVQRKGFAPFMLPVSHQLMLTVQ